MSAESKALDLLGSIDAERPKIDRARAARALRRYLGTLRLHPPEFQWLDRPGTAGAQSRWFERARMWEARDAGRQHVAGRSSFRVGGEERQRERAIDERLAALARADSQAFWLDVGRRDNAQGSFLVVPGAVGLVRRGIDAESLPGSPPYRQQQVERNEEALLALAGAASAGLFAFWIRCGRALLVPRPSMKLEDGQLHRWDGRPAIVWRDGTEHFVWRGVRVGRRVGAAPDRLAAWRIRRASNAEVRSVLLERFGSERFLRRAGAELTATDSFGKLWRVPDRHGSAPIALVEVLNSTPEPDGTRRTYVLQAPPEVRTPREALARSFGFHHEWEYAPIVET
jgi:hypothetical protein